MGGYSYSNVLAQARVVFGKTKHYDQQLGEGANCETERSHGIDPDDAELAELPPIELSPASFGQWISSDADRASVKIIAVILKSSLSIIHFFLSHQSIISLYWYEK